MENTLQNKAKLFETSAEKEVLQVENKTFENYERPSLIDLQKVSVCRGKILELIFSTNIYEGSSSRFLGHLKIYLKATVLIYKKLIIKSNN